MTKLAVIGISGRNKQDLSKLKLDSIEWMMDTIDSYVENIIENPNDQVVLVSGGSAWADHAAIRLFF